MRTLMTATVPSMIGQFNMVNIKLLIELGYEVDVACNFKDRSVWSDEKINHLKSSLKSMNVNTYQIDFERSMLKINNHIKSYKQIKNLMNERQYQLIHTHTPISSFITRIAFKNSLIYEKSKMIYTAHGFHFFKGNNPLKNFLFRNIERYGAKYTDTLITINKEDYEAAKTFKLRENGTVEYIPGVGIDLDKINSIQGNKEELCKELNIPKDSTLLLSVGELNENKNHKVVIEALHNLPVNVHYLICGVGPLKEHHLETARKLRVSKRLHLLGYRNDVIKIMKSCDVFVFPSKREGLGLAAIEAMACGLPIITSNRHGILDYAQDRINAFTCNPNDITEFIKSINNLILDFSLIKKFSCKNLEVSKKYDITIINERMNKIYMED